MEEQWQKQPYWAFKATQLQSYGYRISVLLSMKMWTNVYYTGDEEEWGKEDKWELIDVAWNHQTR